MYRYKITPEDDEAGEERCKRRRIIAQLNDKKDVNYVSTKKRVRKKAKKII
jgi:hypothetical protein